ncbi:MAG: hypothetical protein QM488_18565 [Rhizobiaceae bacterium]
MTGTVTVELPQDIFQTRGGPFGLGSYRFSSASSFQPSTPSFGPNLENLWAFSIEASPLSRRETIYMEAFFARLSTKNWAFRAYDPLRQLPLGFGGGYSPANDEILFTNDAAQDLSFCSDLRLLEGATTALVKTEAPRGADSVLIKGLDLSLAGKTILETGDHFSIGVPGEMNLHMSMSDCVCSATGEARIDFMAKLWKRALPGDIVNFYRPTGRFILVDTAANGSVELVRSSGPLSSGNLSAIEVPYQEPQQ